MSSGSIVAWDTETRGLDWWKPDQRAFLVTWADEHGEWSAEFLPELDEAGVARFFEAARGAAVLVAHNASFDIHQIRETTGVDLLEFGAVIHDTDLMSRVLMPEGQRKGERGGHGLKNLASVYLSADAKDPEEDIKAMAKAIGTTLTKTGAYYDVYRSHKDVMTTYAKADARYTRDLYDVFVAKGEESPAAMRVYEMERKVMPILIEAERRGIATDQDRVAEFKLQFTDQRNELYDRLSSELGDGALKNDDSKGSIKLLREGLLKHGVPLTETTTPDSDLLSTNKFALQKFEEDFPLISDLLEWRRIDRFLTTYIDPCYGVDVIHPSFWQMGGWTGRMSCSRPNMQNWPKRAGKELRSVLVPRPGHAFVVCDYEGIESRLLAYYLGDPDYRELVATHDPHAWMAAQIWGGEPSEYGKGTDKALTHRAPAKNILFAITYGAGKGRVAAMLRDAGLPSTEDEARKIISKIKASLPNYYHLTKHRIEPKIKKYGFVNTITGRKNPVMQTKPYVGLNALIQGSAADIMKLGLIAVAERCECTDSVPLLVVHDEVVVEVPLGYEKEMMIDVGHAMRSAYDLNPPLSVEGSICYHDYSEA